MMIEPLLEMLKVASIFIQETTKSTLDSETLRHD